MSRTQHRFLALAPLLASLSSVGHSMPLSSSSAACECYTADAASTAYFANRKFFDFRGLAATGAPAPIDDENADAGAGVTSAYFASAEWAGTWGIQSWATGEGAVYRVNSANNVYLEDVGGATALTLRARRQPGYMSTAEVESLATDFQHLSMRMYMRTTGDAGAVTALFTYLGSDPVQEADLEIRTMNARTEVQYTNQPDHTDAGPIEGSFEIVNLAQPWTEWQEYRYDWTPGMSEWYVDGVKLAAIAFQAPTDPLSVIMNVWGDGGSWSGTMAEGGQAQMQLQWLDLTYNTAGQDVATSCANVCVVEDLLP
ncbi:concanavalin A-like lectin/glucanase domain-containing protein [Xylariomycetidae sp. FL0641]|nr:concanavalin A-like lectin/glucanase domain-containing protein [Xylariomycetidae sp. FL0641]